MDSSVAPGPVRSRSPLRAILIGGFAAGVGDFVLAMLLYGAPWDRIARSVAGGVLGRAEAVSGPDWVIALGITCHFVVALGAAAVFVLASRRLRWLGRHPGPVGLGYGVVVYLVMNWVVVPASALVLPHYPPPVDWRAVVGHMVLVGLPIALASFWWGTAKR